MKNHPCYSDEWKRSRPDFVVYLPKQAVGPDTDNVHLLVTVTPKGNLLGFWTQATYECADNTCVVCSRSNDGGETWSQPTEIDGPNEARRFLAHYAFPVVSRAGRIYCFYSKVLGPTNAAEGLSGIVRCRYSDDDGYTWSAPEPIPFQKREGVDDPDPRVMPSWIAWCKAVRDSRGRWLQPFSHVISYAHPQTGNAHMDMMRFDNLDEGPDPKDIRITWLPGTPLKPAPGPALKGLFEPCIVLLPDGRLFMVMRTLTGSPWCSVSEDDGLTWRDAEPLRYHDGGERVLHPGSPPPLYGLEDGRYLLQFHNNDGSMGDGIGAGESKWSKPNTLNRRSLFLAVGRFRPRARQPIWFSPPKRLADSDGTPAGLQHRTEMGTYSSLTERNGRRVIWYPDRKHFLLGKLVPDEWLAELEVPDEVKG